MTTIRKCAQCKSTTLIEYFDKNRKGEYFKTCNNCRMDARERMKGYIQNLPEDKLEEYRRKNKGYREENKEEIIERKKKNIYKI